MTKHLIIALLGSSLLAGGALAQTNAPNMKGPAASNQATAAPASTAAQGTNESDGKGALFRIHQGQWRSTKLIGLKVYNSNNDDIGDINDLIMGQDGRVEAVVIGVGGFLGMGEHDVAVPFGQVRFVEQSNVDRTAAAGRPAANSSGSVASTPKAPAPVSASAEKAGAAASNSAQSSGMAGSAPETTGAVARNNADTGTGQSETGYRGYPDRAVVNMNKDQLKALPEVRYAR